MSFDWPSASLVLAALSVSYTVVRNLTVDNRAARERKEKAFAEVKAHGEQCRHDFDTYKESTTQQLLLMMDVVKKSTDMHVAVATLLAQHKHFEAQLQEAKNSIQAVQQGLAKLTERLYDRA